MTPPTISLCMIVRDEAEVLPQFFAAAAGLWDELVVVDTGSRDETVALAAAAGARVLHHVWKDDFSAARNAGLAAATGDWILYLDADELADPALADAVRRAVADDGVGAATLLMRNDMPDGHSRVTPLLRLFRRDPSVTFRHRIHEEVSTPIAASLRRTGRRLEALPAEVRHLGYGRERAAARNKKVRDLVLLEACVAEDPTDFYSWFKLLELARFWADEALARDKARACFQWLARTGPGALQDCAFGGELVALGASALHAAAPAAAARAMDVWGRQVPPSAAFHLKRGELAERLGDAARAAQEFHRCLALDEQTADRQLSTVRPLMGLARLALAADDLEVAWRHVERALEHNHLDPEALLAAVTICQHIGGQRMVDDLAAVFRDKYGDETSVERVAMTATAA